MNFYHKENETIFLKRFSLFEKIFFNENVIFDPMLRIIRKEKNKWVMKC